MFYAMCILVYKTVSLLEFFMKVKGIKVDFEIIKRNIKANTFRDYFIQFSKKLVKTKRKFIVYKTKLEESWLKILESFWNSFYGFEK